MKTVWIASIALMASASALAQSTIYKHVDENGRVTYTNRPMKGRASSKFCVTVARMVVVDPKDGRGGADA